MCILAYSYKFYLANSNLKHIIIDVGLEKYYFIYNYIL